MLARRVLEERSPLLAGGLTYSLSCVLLLGLANLSCDGVAAWLVLAALLPLLARRAPPALEWPRFSAPAVAVLGISALAIVGFANLSNNVSPDDDFWIHFPLQGLLREGGLPVRHPFFSEIVMNGHYGRDLLLAAVSRHSGLGLLQALFWQTALCQVASFLTILGLVHRSSGSQHCAALATLAVFFGVNVGGRGGLLDCFQNNNALAYLLTLSVMHLLHLVWLRPTAARVLTAGVTLGTMALVYETHFGLLGLSLLTALCLSRRKELAYVGALALLLAAAQGGPISKLVQERLHPAARREWTPGELNQHQIVKLTFPKKELFQIQLAYGDYQRRSLVYGWLPELGTISAIAPGTPYRSILSWDVLKIHWLPTLLAPLSLLVLLRHRRDVVALGFWTLGAWAYVTPALVHFGPIYEFEYFRWQFAAGFAFAAALGIAVGRCLEGRKPWLKVVGVGLFAMLDLAPSVALFYPRLLATARDSATWIDALLPRSQLRWVMAQSPQLGGFDRVDARVAARLRALARPGDRLLANSPWRTPTSLHFDSTLIALSGVRSVGHSLPWPQEPVGTPPYHRSAPARAFWLAPSLELLDRLEVDWVYLRPGPENEGPLIRWLDQNMRLVWSEGHSRLYRRRGPDPKEAPLVGVSETASQETAPALRYLAGEGYTSQLFFFEAVPDGRLWAWGFVKAGQPASSVDLHELVTWRSGPAALVTPPQSGEYELVFFEVKDGLLFPAVPRQPFQVRVHY